MLSKTLLPKAGLWFYNEYYLIIHSYQCYKSRGLEVLIPTSTPS